MCDAYVVMFGLARAKIKFIIVWDPSRVGVESECVAPLRLHDETERVVMETHSSQARLLQIDIGSLPVAIFASGHLCIGRRPRVFSG